jgi:SAM-dependent methyltransferase
VGRAESLDAGGYDVVLAVHSLYYVADLRETVEQLRTALRPGGELVIALAPRAELNALAATLAPPVDGHRQWWAADLDAVLDGLDVERDRIGAVLDLEDCLDPDDATGCEVLDFAIQAVLPPALREAVVDHLLSVRVAGPGLRIAHPVDLRVVRGS